MTTESCFKIVIDIATAFGTIAVAILAIWGERIRSWLSPTKLEIGAHNNFRGDPNLLTSQLGQQVGRGMFYHLKVINKRPWLPIKNCRVLLMGISRRGPDNVFHPSPLVVPSQLIWAPASFAPTLVAVTKEQIVDLGNIREGDSAFRLALYSTPNNFAGLVGKDEAVRFELAIEADNFSSSRYKVIEVAWDGIWEFEPEKMENHLRIREIREP
jgi:hypothetical protein